MQKIQRMLCIVIISQVFLLFGSSIWADDEEEDRSETLRKRYPRPYAAPKTSRLENDLHDLENEFKWATDPHSSSYFGHTLLGFLNVHPYDYDQVPKEEYSAIIFGAVVENLQQRFKTKLDPVLSPPKGDTKNLLWPLAKAYGKLIAERNIYLIRMALKGKKLPYPTIKPSLSPDKLLPSIMGKAGKGLVKLYPPAYALYQLYSLYSFISGLDDDLSKQEIERREKWLRDAEREIGTELGTLKQVCEQEIRNYYKDNEE